MPNLTSYKFQSLISSDEKPRGILKPISPTRSCSDIAKITAEKRRDFCICEQKAQLPVTSDEIKNIIRAAEISLNEMIPQNATKVCRKIEFAKSASNLKKYSISNTSYQYSAILDVKDFVFQKMKVTFSILLEQRESDAKLILKSYERIDIYARFAECASIVSWVKSDLCICS